MQSNLIKKIQDSDIKKVLISAFALISGNFVSTIIGLIGTLVQGRYVTAEMLGYYKQFTILSGYIFVFHLGVYQALERLLPYFYGKNEDEEAKKYTAVAYAWISFCVVVITGIFVVLGCRSLIMGDFRAAICWFSQIFTSVYTLISGVLASTYRSLKDFEKLAKANVIGSVATLLSIPVFLINPFIGLILKSVLNSVAIFPLLKDCPIKVRPKFKVQEFSRLLKQGLPIFTASYITGTGLDTIRNTLVLSYINLEGLGLWNFAYMFYTMIIVIPNSLVAVINPRIIRDYGQSGSLRYIIKKYRIPVLGVVGFISASAVIGGILIGWLVPIVIPNYIASIPIMIALLPCFVLRTLDIFYTMLLAVNDMKWINYISLISSGVQLILILLLHQISTSVYIFSSALTLGLIAKYFLTIGRIMYLSRRER